MIADRSSTHRRTLKFLSVVGTRPQFVKLAPICRVIETLDLEPSGISVEHRIVHTGQHYDPDIAEVFFHQMRIPEPDYNLGVGSAAQGIQIGRMLERLDPILSQERPDWVLVYGDTNSTLAGALLAARLGISLAHIEAGCRSGNLGMPEEQNRILSDQLSQILFAPSQEALRNLECEGFSMTKDTLGRRMVFAGDLTYDALRSNLGLAKERAGLALQTLGLESGQYYLLTVHRTANTDEVDKLLSILEAVQTLDLPVLFPIHPRTRNVLSNAQIQLNENIRSSAPLSYLEMIHAEMHARKILTDSGGVQKEAFYLGVPCVTLREETEWPDTVTFGANRLVGTNVEKIRQAAQAEYPTDWLKFNSYGSGDAAARIVQTLLAESAEALGSQIGSIRTFSAENA